MSKVTYIGGPAIEIPLGLPPATRLVRFEPGQPTEVPDEFLPRFTSNPQFLVETPPSPVAKKTAAPKES